MTQSIKSVHEPFTGTWQYIVADTRYAHAAIIDPVLDYDKETGIITTTSADELLDIIASHGYTISHILETHAHADHLTASRYLQAKLAQRQQQRPLVCIGQGIQQVQNTMGQLYGAFDHTFPDGSDFHIGDLQARVIHLPGHTPDHIGYVIGENIFTGDSIFNPDVSSARCDFPGGSATDLYASSQKLLAFPENYRLYTGHDYPPKDRACKSTEGSEAVPYTTVGEQKLGNKHVKVGTKLGDFVKWRTERDAGLSDPKLLRQAMHVNVRGGRLPASPVEGFKITSVPECVPSAA
ncbi:hypothetical protein B0A48_18659 [Cryoendolithus antarcticus]|uniref:Metallo-beta-lactamase domain-containing protein n=1 Tax=Cryoendolithus antarcticus TaxID=1507870 RepID=A0A1V8S8F3_9PEZI|nr:hypothetical protein B0A48_18659 [Cryoendolithus antarcticus]